MHVTTTWSRKLVRKDSKFTIKYQVLGPRRCISTSTTVAFDDDNEEFQRISIKNGERVPRMVYFVD
jgi:hypothetical protein